MVVREEGPYASMYACIHTHALTHTLQHLQKWTHCRSMCIYTKSFMHTVLLNADNFLWFQFLRGTFVPKKISHPKSLSTTMPPLYAHTQKYIGYAHTPKGPGFLKTLEKMQFYDKSPKLLTCVCVCVADTQ